LKKHHYLYYIFATICVIILGQLSALNNPLPWEDYVYFPHNYAKQEQDTLQRKVVVSEAVLKPGSPEYIDSMKQARQRYVDSMKAAQKAYQDSLRIERARIADSTQQANKRYNDSIRAQLDAEKLVRQRIADSTKAVQQQRKDSLDAIKAYKESKAYKDSVANAKQARADSIAQMRQMRNDSLTRVRAKMKDSLAQVRTRMQDSLAQERTRIKDSLAVARQQFNDSVQQVIAAQKARNLAIKDSINVVRTLRNDSLAKAKLEREELAKKRQKERLKAANAKARAKEKKARDAYTNEDMRKKKWSFLRKVYHNTTTRYNYYFNANERLKVIEKNMLKTSVNNYDTVLTLLPFDPDKDSAKYAKDLDSLIHKASIGIQIHDPRGQWQDDLYLTIGKAFYYKGDYKNAIASFKYVVATAEKEKKEAQKQKARKKGKKATGPISDLADKESNNPFTHTSAKNDAVLWLARTLATDSQTSIAQTVLNMLRSSEQYDKEQLDGRYALAQSFLDFRNNNLATVTDHLLPLVKDKNSPNWLRQRAAFIRGQLLQNAGKFQESDAAFDDVIALQPEMEMDFYARINKVNNSIASGNANKESLLANLNKMSKETKYKDYLGKINFAQARIFEANKDTVTALDFYKKSIGQNEKYPTQKGLAYASIGDLYYGQNNYSLAKKSYDSALVFLSDAQNPVFATATQRAGALDFIAAPGSIVKQNDSLLRLAQMSEKDQLALIKKYLRDREKQITDSVYAAKNAANAPAPLPGPTTLGSSKQSWYFGNPNTVQQGITSFKQKWGNRTLKDDWNRSSNFTAGVANDDDPTADMSEEDKLIANLPSPEDLLALIPKTSEEIDSVKKSLEQAKFELGIGYFKHMEDIPMAIKTFDELDAQFPAHPYGAELTYYRYLIATNKGDKNLSAQYAQALAGKYASSEWNKMVLAAQTPIAEGNLAINNIALHYEEAYTALMSQDYAKAFRDAEAAPVLFPKEFDKYKNKYTLIKYASIVGQKDYKSADSLLTDYISRNQNDETKGWAMSLQEYTRNQINELNKYTALTPTNSNAIQVIKDSTLVYEHQPNNLHYVLISAVNPAFNLNGLKAGLKDYNNTKANRRKLEVSLAPISSQKNLIVIQEFKNASEAQKYILEIKAVKELFRDFNNASEYEILTISNDNIIKLYTDQDWEAYKAFHNLNY
jgi:hypothetical protein